MNEIDLDRALDLAYERFLQKSEEEHRAIRNNPRYDGLFHIMEEMASVIEDDKFNEDEKYFESYKFLISNSYNKIIDDYIKKNEVNSDIKYDKFYKIPKNTIINDNTYNEILSIQNSIEKNPIVCLTSLNLFDNIGGDIWNAA